MCKKYAINLWVSKNDITFAVYKVHKVNWLYDI